MNRLMFRAPLRAACCGLALFCTLSVSGCSEDTIVSAPDIGVIQPLATGNAWIYRGVRYNEVGDSIEVFSSTTKIEEPVDVDGTVWFSVSSTGGGVLQRNAPGGLYNLQDVREAPLLRLPYPGRVGTSYPLYPGTESATTVLSTDTLITVPAGTYHCYHYRYYHSRSTISEHTDYFAAPNVGLIRAVSYVAVAPRPDAATVRYAQSDLISVTLK